MTIVSASTCAPLAGQAVHICYCDKLGRYALYSSADLLLDLTSLSVFDYVYM